MAVAAVVEVVMRVVRATRTHRLRPMRRSPRKRQRRYLNYALSVITSRALPDVRDGLKPVQRRILYAMYANLHLYPDAKHRKCATIVGDVMGKFHPHGDTSSTTPWCAWRRTSRCAAAGRRARQLRLARRRRRGRLPLHRGAARAAGDGAARRDQAGAPSTSARTTTARTESRSCCRRVPQLLVNGCTGIAVGMATNIPPHNLGEVCDAAVALIDDPELQTKDLLKHIKGPDFPTGGQVLNSKKELREIYETGQGTIRVRGEWKIEAGGRAPTQIIVTSIPYAVTKSTAGRADRRRDHRARSCRCWSTCATSRPTTCASCWSSRRAPIRSW